ncbi:MAG TPA: tRNA lysidine(34) synthetase TilS [Thermomicrobiales bacterium]|nr:tRNA lysidine(34) synthetase TilS [Thermomicrobiales bacterium]
MSSNEQERQPRPSIPKESGLLQRARLFLRGSFPDGVPHIVVGYSGGRDSLALLLVFRELQRLGVCGLTAVHVDHGLRPDSADAAAEAVAVAERLGVACALVAAGGDLRMRWPGESVEDVARKFRYQALASVLGDVGGDAVAVGHHRRDQAETVLLHILRGSGLAGLRGMEADGTLVFAGANRGIRVIRPFLREAPETLDELVQRSGLPVIEDPTNEQPEFRRNRIRHELLPLLEEIAPGSSGRLVSLADILRADDEALEDVAHALVHRTMDDRGNLGWGAVRGAPLGLQRRVVRRWILHGGYPGELGLERVDAVVELAKRNEGGKRVELGGGWSVRFGRGQLDLVPPDGGG